MAKKDLLKSTSEGKKTGKPRAGKKAAPKKAAPKKVAPKKVAPKKAARKKAAPKKAAAKKAAAKKAAAEKAAIEKAAAEQKAAEEKAAAEKAAAEKAAAERAAAEEKAAEEKVAAEKAAIEKAAAEEKVAAEKAAIEKAAAERAAAEQKAVEEKVAAEKAAIEKAADEKAADEYFAEKKAAEETAAAEKTIVEQNENMDSLKRSAVRFIAGSLLVMLPVIIASFMNTHDYYIKEADGAVEIWKGRFAPMGKYRMLSLPGGMMPEAVQEEYAKNEIFPLIFEYYIEKVDALLKVPGLPDFEGIKSELNTARSYAVSRAHKRTVSSRLTSLDFMILWYKADVEIGKGTVNSLESAIVLLKEASRLDLDSHNADLVDKRVQSVQAALAAIRERE